MNRIMKIDRRSRYVRVEPGVTFGTLVPLLAEHGMRMNLPFLARAGKSVTTSALEREAVLIPKYQYDYPDPLLTVETVFGTGDVFRTGSAAGPGTYEQNRADKVLPWGPGTIDYLRFLSAAQGTIGFVTWATLKTEILPSASRLFFIAAENVGQLTALANTLTRKRVPDECIILSRENFAAAFANDIAEEEKLRSCAPWIMLCRVCGFDRYPEERVAIYERYVREAAADAGMCVETEYAWLPELETRIESMLVDCDRRKTNWKLRLGAQKELLMAAPPSKVAAIVEHIARKLPCAGLTVQPQVQGRAYRIECNLRFENPADSEKQETLLFELACELTNIGAYFDRPYGQLSKLVFNEAQALNAVKRLKKIFDPDGILNPGKLCF